MLLRKGECCIEEKSILIVKRGECVTEKRRVCY